MLTKFSVKKPQTIFVSVFMIIILGCVSFTNMTPDLLPNINLPYTLIMTVYAGATPEVVEDEVTQPIESAMATLEDVENITSTSSENMSMVILEFADDASMDTVVSDIREEINNISDDWNEMVSTPYIMEINPDMMPVTIAAVSYEGLDSVALTEFMESELLNKLEGIDGVASVDVSGAVTEQVNVFLSQEKIDELNRKITGEIEAEFDDAKAELADGQAELNDGKSELESAESELSDAESELLAGQETLASETAAAQAEIVSQKFALAETKTELEEQLATAQAGLAELQTAQTSLQEALTGYNTLQSTKTQLEEAITALTTIKSGYQEALTAQTTLTATIETLEANGQDASIYQAQLVEVQTQIMVMDTTLSTLGTDYTNLDAKTAEYQANLTIVQTSIDTLNTELQASMGIDGSMLSASLDEIVAQVATVQDGVSQLEAALALVESGDASLTEALEQVNYAQVSGALEISEGYSQIVVGQSAIESALTELEAAQSTIDDAKEEIEDAEESAYSSAKMDITMDMINMLLTAQNFSMPAGYITEDDMQYLIRVGDEVETLEELQNLPLMYLDIDGVGTITLSDVAEVTISDTASEIYTKLDSEDAIILSFSKQSTAATADVSSSINETFEELEDEYFGLSFLSLTDQGDYIDLIVDNVLSSLLLGGLFAVLILLFFLKDIRPTVIIACSIPVSLLFAVVLMYFSGITLNIISLSGLAIGVGMLVDNSVVVIENIYRMRAEGEDKLKAAVKGATQVAGAICASTLTTICVFLPIVFVDGITRQLFTDMALTIGYSLGASLIVAITLVPAMASGMLTTQKEHKDVFINKLTEVYEKLARHSLKRKWIVLTGSVVLLVVSVYVSISQGFIFMPSMSGSQITISVTPENEDAKFEELTTLAGDVYGLIEGIEDIESVGIMVDEDSGITMYGVLCDDAERKDSEICKEIESICEELPCEVSASGSMDMTSMLSAMSGSGVTVQIFGDDLDALMEEAELLATELESLEGISEVSTGLEENDVEYSIEVDAEKAAENGLTIAEVYQYVAAAINTETDSITVSIDGSNRDIIIHQDEDATMTISGLEDYVMEFTDQLGENQEVKLTDVAEIVETESLNAINRENQNRTLTVTATVSDDYNVTLVSTEAEKLLSDYEPIAGNTIEISGESETIMEAITQLALMLLLGVVMIYFIMVAQFQSYKEPLVVMFTIPLAFTGGFLGLLLTGKDMSVIAMVGFVMLAGIIVNNGIVLIDYINVLRLDGMEKREAIILAGKTRMRPILMTASTTVLGLVFMALGTGVGTEMMQPIAIVCIGGLIYATIMTLFVVPAMYDILSSKHMEKRIVE
ncbi:MAG: efflux RND transporter permease subunit [Eubacteriales bacterium]